MKKEFSAGGVVYKVQDGNVLWLLVQHSGYHGWIFPKGHIEPGEKSHEAALREVLEESGVSGKIIESLFETKYFYVLKKERIFKTVKFFLMEAVEERPSFDYEVSQVIWLPYDEAKEKLTFKDEKEMLEKAKREASLVIGNN